ncbi:MAG: hypothetical protein LKE37_03420 [Atopobiaceae bacterium]|nr:hypothetical protein [Atopobiaceae bacterium]
MSFDRSEREKALALASALLGVACGLVGCIPPAVLFERALKARAHPSLVQGLASIAASFAALSVAVLAASAFLGKELLAFAIPMVVAFLAFWAVESVRVWRSANGRR